MRFCYDSKNRNSSNRYLLHVGTYKKKRTRNFSNGVWAVKKWITIRARRLYRSDLVLASRKERFPRNFVITRNLTFYIPPTNPSFLVIPPVYLVLTNNEHFKTFSGFWINKHCHYSSAIVGIPGSQGAYCASFGIFDEQLCAEAYDMTFGNAGLYGKRSEESKKGMYFISKGIV